jgi:hypothetical protein
MRYLGPEEVPSDNEIQVGLFGHYRFTDTGGKVVFQSED